MELGQAIVEKFKSQYHIFHVCRKESPTINDVERIDMPLDNLQLFSILAKSQKRVFNDSCLQHAAAAFKLKSTVLWVGTSPKVFGYRLHDNIEAKKTDVANQRINSYLFDFQFDNNLHECPYLSAQEMFDFNQVLSKI